MECAQYYHERVPKRNNPDTKPNPKPNTHYNYIYYFDWALSPVRGDQRLSVPLPKNTVKLGWPRVNGIAVPMGRHQDSNTIPPGCQSNALPQSYRASYLLLVDTFSYYRAFNTLLIQFTLIYFGSFMTAGVGLNGQINLFKSVSPVLSQVVSWYGCFVVV